MIQSNDTRKHTQHKHTRSLTVQPMLVPNECLYHLHTNSQLLIESSTLLSVVLLQV